MKLDEFKKKVVEINKKRCPICDKIFCDKTFLRNHLRNVHSRSSIVDKIMELAKCR